MGYFLKTYLENGTINRLRALPGQRFSNSVDVPTDLNIQGSHAVRERNAIGTIFYCDDLARRSAKGTKNDTQFLMAIGRLVPMNSPNDPLKPTKEMMDEFETFMKNNETAAEAATNKRKATPKPGTAKSLLERIRTEKRFSRPTIETDGFAITQDKWETIVTFIYNQDNLLLTGPSGTGKTEVVMLACKRMGIDCRKYNMATMGDPQSAMLGVHRMRNGQSVFDEAQFLQDIQKPGVILLDEINRAPATAMNYLFSCCDGTRELRNDYTSPAQTVKVHPECVFIATANIGAEFVGTNIIDPALDSRFSRVEMDYPSINDEASVLQARFHIDRTAALNICKTAADIRANNARQELSKTVTVRQTLMAGKLVANGYSTLEALERVFLPYFEGNDSEGERSIVKKIICSR